MLLSQNIPGLLFFAGSYNGGKIYRTSNYGVSWTTVVNDYGVWFTDLEQDPFNQQHFVASAINSEQTEIYHSYDSGVNWDISLYPMIDVEVNDILFSPTTPNRFYCAAEEGIYVTEDGENFFKVLDVATKQLETDPDRPGEMYAACGENGVYYNTTGSWEQFPSFYRDDISVETVEIVGTGWLYAGTDEFGVFRLQLESLGINNPETQTQPTGLTILQTPAVNTVTILVNPTANTTTLTVFDLAGRAQHQTTLPPSTDTQTLTLNNLTPGIYFATTNTNEQAVRFVMLKD